jgi:hypothetical protein
MSQHPLILLALHYAWAFIGTWYKWGGDDPSGFDCSGLVVEILQAVGLLSSKSDYGAQALYRLFPRVDKPAPGCLAFWGEGETKISHVEMVIEVFDGKVFTIGASGGGSKTLTVADAIKANAFVKLRQVLGPGRRQDLVGYTDPFHEVRNG